MFILIFQFGGKKLKRMYCLQDWSDQTGNLSSLFNYRQGITWITTRQYFYSPLLVNFSSAQTKRSCPLELVRYLEAASGIYIYIYIFRNTVQPSTLGKIAVTLEPHQSRDGDMSMELLLQSCFCSIILLELLATTQWWSFNITHLVELKHPIEPCFM